MLFRKRIPRSCQYCAFSAELNKDQMLCTKQGVVSAYFQCRKFRYAPCKRIPIKARALDFKKYEEDDFTL